MYRDQLHNTNDIKLKNKPDSILLAFLVFD